MSRLASLMRLYRLGAIAVIALASIAVVRHAHAEVSLLQLGHRSCGSVTAYVQYDSFSEGNPPFFAVFAADLNGNGVFGESNEPVVYVLVGPGGTAGTVSAQLNFPAVPQGSSISITAYEIDSAGGIVSPQLPPVSYICSHRPAEALASSNPGAATPQVAVTVKITTNAVQVYDQPSANGNIIDGLPHSAIVNVIGRNSRGDWIKVQYGGTTGWIMWVTNAILFGPYQQLPIVG